MPFDCANQRTRTVKIKLGNKVRKQAVRSQRIPTECYGGILHQNELRAGVWQEECRIGGVGVRTSMRTGRSASGGLHSIIARQHVAVTLWRGDAEHSAAVDRALTQLLKHSVGLLHRKHTEHWRNNLQPTSTTSCTVPLAHRWPALLTSFSLSNHMVWHV